MFKSIISLALASYALAAPLTSNKQTCIPSGQFDSNLDYFPDKIQDGPGFTVKYEKSFKTVTNTIANETYVLYQCGSPKPTTQYKTFAVPISTVAMQDVTSLTFVEMLSKVATIKYIDSLDLVVSPCIATANKSGSITSLASGPNDLAAQFASVDVVLGFAQDDTIKNSVVFSATGSKTAEARTAWLNYISLWYNQEATSQPIAKGIMDNYECVAKVAAPLASKPIVAWTDYAPPADFNNNTATWSVVSPGYKTSYTTDSGAQILTAKSFTDNAAFLKYVASVDYLVDESFLGTESWSGFLKAYGLSETSDLKFVKNKQVWRTDKMQNALGWTAWFEEAVPSTNLVLSDLTSIVQPTLLSGYKRTFFRNIATEPIGQPGSVNVQSAVQCTGAYNVATVTCPKAPSPASGAQQKIVALALVVLAMLI